MDSYVKQYKSRKQTIINGEVVDIEFIRKYYKKLSYRTAPKANAAAAMPVSGERSLSDAPCPLR